MIRKETNTEQKDTNIGQKETPNIKRVRFDGRFTDIVRKLIRDKRLELGLPYHTVSQYFSINWSTFRKWESGETRRCELRHRPLIEAFINGDLDEDLKAIFISSNMKYPQGTPIQVYQAMERIANTYTLCSHHPEIGDDLLSKIEDIALNTLRTLVSTPRQDITRPYLLAKTSLQRKKR